jgi:hypothetical protein
VERINYLNQDIKLAKKRTKKSVHHSNPLRPLTQIEKVYLEELSRYDQVLDVTMHISRNQHRISTDGRGMRGMKIFTRQTLTGVSLRQILAQPSTMTHPNAEIWDITSIASLSRNLMEGYIQLHFYGLETVSEEEAELRFFIAQLHRNKTWKNIIEATDPDNSILEDFKNGIPEELERIKTHPFYISLDKDQRKRIIERNDIYKSKADFENQLEVCQNFTIDHRHLSNLAHPLPFSFERIDNKKGRGIGSDAEVNYSIVCLMIARKYLAASTVGIADHFHDDIGKKFASKIEKIRPLILAGYESNN